LDKTPAGDRAGCEELRKKVEEMTPAAHVFGHIHHFYGKTEKFGVKFVNASSCDESYAPVKRADCFRFIIYIADASNPAFRGGKFPRCIAKMLKYDFCLCRKIL
jgi:hypothetical protein